MRRCGVRFLFAAAAVLCAVSASSHAIVTLDLRAAGVTAGAGTVVNAKSITLGPTAAPGTVITLDLWAVVTGSDGTGTNETLTTLSGMMLLSSPGTTPNLDTGITGNSALTAVSFASPLLGNLANTLLVPWNIGAGSSNGAQADLDGDADLDVGSATAVLPSPAYITARVDGSPQTSGPAGSFNELPYGREWRIATATFTLTSFALDGGTGINAAFVAATPVAQNTRATFQADGVLSLGADANLAVAQPIIVTGPNAIPEPGSAALLGAGALLLLRRRR